MRNNKQWYKGIIIGWGVGICFIAAMLITFMALSQEKPKVQKESPAPIEQKKEISKEDMMKAYEVLLQQNSKIDSIISVRLDTNAVKDTIK